MGYRTRIDFDHIYLVSTNQKIIDTIGVMEGKTSCVCFAFSSLLRSISTRRRFRPQRPAGQGHGIRQLATGDFLPFAYLHRYRAYGSLPLPVDINLILNLANPRSRSSAI